MIATIKLTGKSGVRGSAWGRHHKAVRVVPWEGEGGTAQTTRHFGPHWQSQSCFFSSSEMAASCRAKALEGQCSFRYIEVTGAEESDPHGNACTSAGTKAPSRQHLSGHNSDLSRQRGNYSDAVARAAEGHTGLEMRGLDG